MSKQNKHLTSKPLNSLNSSKSLIKDLKDLKGLNLPDEKIFSESFKFLSQSYNRSFKNFAKDIDILMRYLSNRLPKHVHHLLWINYFNLSVKLKKDLHKSDKDFDGAQFNEIQANLIKQYDLEKDWRILRKLRHLEPHFSIKRSSDDVEILINGFKETILKSLEYIVWHDDVPFFLGLARKSLRKLYAFIRNSDKREHIVESIINGRFEKGIFCDQTLILGEDGGLYLLLNSLNGEELEELQRVTGGAFYKKEMKEKNKIVVDNGGMYTVRFALSLFLTKKTLPGKLACIKKSKSINYLSKAYSQIEKNQNSESSAISSMIDSTLATYYSSNNDIKDLIYESKFFDLALIISSNMALVHQKSYIIMELIPFNTYSTELFKKKSPLDWVSDLKPCIKQLFEKILALLDKNMFISHLRPENILYDLRTKILHLLDFNGAFQTVDDIEKCILKNYDIEFDLDYTAPEILDENSEVIDLRKALAFSCGKIFKEIIEVHNGGEDLLSISEYMMDPDPKLRMSIELGLKKILKIGDEVPEQIRSFEHYINEIKNRIESNRNSIGIKEDINNLRELFILPRGAKADPDEIKDQDTTNLCEKILEFIEADSVDPNLFLILGNSGSGKSLTLQLQFINAITSWNSSKPLPIYFKLSNGLNLKEIIKSLDFELETSLSNFLFDKSIEKKLILFVDSFDEGNFQNDIERESLFRKYAELLGSKMTKFIVACKTHYISQYANSDTFFFVENKKGNHQFQNKYYITPLNYNIDASNENHQQSSSIINLAKSYIKTASKLREVHGDEEKFVEFIQLSKLESEIDSGIDLEMLATISQFYEKEGLDMYDERYRIKSRIDLCRKYISIVIETNLKEKFPLNQEQKHLLIKKDLSEFDKQIKIILYELGIYISKSLHIKGESILSSDDKLFELLDKFLHENKMDFLWSRPNLVLRNLPLNFEIKKEQKFGQQITVQFTSTIIKNYFLLEAIKQEAKVHHSDRYCSKILGARNFTHDIELITFIRDGLLEDTESYAFLTNFLLKQTYLTREIKDEQHVNSASNSMTILIAAQYIFSEQDLSSTVIRNANLRNGYFEYSNFSNTDLRGSQMSLAKLGAVAMTNTNLSNVNLGMLPDLQGHSENINSLSFSPDGLYIATCSWDTTAKIWEISSGKLLHNLQEHSDNVKNVRFSPDKKHLATCSWDFTTKIWEVSSGKLVKSLEGHAGAVNDLIFSPDGKFLATCSSDKTSKIWEISSGKQMRTLQVHTDKVNCLSLEPDGKYLASCSRDTTAIIWEFSSGKKLHLLLGHEKNVNHLTFSPDGKLLATCSWDATTKIWEVSSGKLLHNLNESNSLVLNLSFSADGKYLATCHDDSTAMLWTVSSGKLHQILQGHTSRVYNVSFSPNRKYLATCSKDTTAKIWEVSTGKQLQTLQGHTNEVLVISFSPDGKYVVTGSDDATVKFWEISPGKQLQNLQGHSEGVLTCNFSQDGKYMATCSRDRTAKVWDLYSGKHVQTFQGHGSFVFNTAFSPDGKILATCSWDNTARIWEISSGKQLQILRGHTKGVFNISFSPDGKLLASCSADSLAVVWEVSSGKSVKILQKHNDSVNNVSFSPNGKVIATCSADKTAIIWDLSSEKKPTILQGHNENVINMSFSPDGRSLATCSWDTTAKIWEVSTGRQLRTLQGHGEKINNIVFSPDGQCLATCSPDKTAMVWEASSGRQLRILQGHNQNVKSVCFSPDGRYLATCSADKSVRISEISFGNQLHCLQSHGLAVNDVKFSPDGRYLVSCSWDTTTKIFEVSYDSQWKQENFQNNSSFLVKLSKDLIGFETSLRAPLALMQNCKMSLKNKTMLEQRGAKVANFLQEDPLLPEPSRVIPNLLKSSFDEFKALKLISESSSLDIMKIQNQTKK